MLAQQIVNGLTLGAVYTLLALSYSLVMGILGVLNLAIAEIFMFGAYIGFSVLSIDGSLWVAIAAGMAGSALIAVIVEKIGYEPLRNAPPVTPMLSTLGFSIILQNVATNLWGSDPFQLDGQTYDGRISLGTVSIGVLQIAVICASAVLVSAVAYLVHRTNIGRALRAVAEDRDISRLLGISAQRLTMIAFGISGALAGAAGVLIAVHYGAITPGIGIDIGLKAIAVMVVGGSANIWGALVAGPLIGVIEVLTVAYAGSQLRDFAVYGLMILVLLLRPKGLLGGAGRELGQRV